MGEEVDLSAMPETAAEPAKAPEIKKGDNEAVYKQVLELINHGHKHRNISSSLRALGFTYIDIEKMLARADAEIYDRKHQEIDYRVIGIVAAAIILAIGIVAVLGGVFVSGAQDCDDDILCSQKILYCNEGLYQSSFSGSTYEYDVRKEIDSCRVTEKVIESSIPQESAGMSMVCDYPLFNGMTDTSDRYGWCSGTLADAHM